MSSDGRRRIGRALARLFVARRRDGDRPRPEPACEYGLVVEERLRDLAADFEELKGLLRWLIFAVAGTLIAVVVEMVVSNWIP